MILALDKHAALHIFSSTGDAESYLEAIDVQDGAFEFCDSHGQRFAVTYTRPPTRSRPGWFGIGSVDIGAFKLTADGGIDASLPASFVERAAHVEHTSFPDVTTIDALKHELHNRA